MYFHHFLLLEFIFETVFELTEIILPHSLHPFSNSVSQLFQPGWKRTETLQYSQVQLLEDCLFPKSRLTIQFSCNSCQLSLGSKNGVKMFR